MFVRWKVKPRANTWTRETWRKTKQVNLLTAYLVESVRVNGKPRQKTIYLASIKDTCLDYPSHRLHFWKAVQAKIEPLHLPIEQQRIIKDKLLERVPDVTREQLQQQNEELARQTAEVKKALGRE